jgi:hypothetical protein
MESLWPERPSWGNDPHVKQWPFYSHPDVAKHVSHAAYAPTRLRQCPTGLPDAVPARYRQLMIDKVLTHHAWGFQPGWADYPNVTPWHVEPERPLNYGHHGEFGLLRSRNTLVFATQLAARFGYRRLLFIGCDLVEASESRMRVLRECHRQSLKAGIEWMNLSARSRLREFVPTCNAAAA